MVSVRYGKGERSVVIPQGVHFQVIRKKDVSTITDPDAEVRSCFSQPVGSPPLSDLAKVSDNACIAICDITRPVPNGVLLRPMIETLRDSGIPLSRITIIVATGLHRPNLGEELDQLLGDPWVKRHVKVVNHDANADELHIMLGRTDYRGTVVRLDRRFVEADLRIVTGLVEPHFMAGYSGGRKVIAPGLAHKDTIRTFHNAEFMSDPKATSCTLAGNPLHEEQLEIVKMLGPTYAVNTVIDEFRQLSRINFGEVISSHLTMVDLIRDDCEIPINQQFDTVLTSAAGHPLDATYYQTIKGMVTALGILKPGGDLIVASACDEGFGSDAFRRSQERLIQLGPDALLKELLDKTLAETDEWQTQKQLEAMKTGQIHLFSEALSEEDFRLTGVHCTRDLQATLNNCLSKYNDPSLAIIPEGPYVIPKYQPVSMTNG